MLFNTVKFFENKGSLSTPLFTSFLISVFLIINHKFYQYCSNVIKTDVLNYNPFMPQNLFGPDDKSCDCPFRTIIKGFRDGGKRANDLRQDSRYIQGKFTLIYCPEPQKVTFLNTLFTCSWPHGSLIFIFPAFHERVIYRPDVSGTARVVRDVGENFILFHSINIYQVRDSSRILQRWFFNRRIGFYLFRLIVFCVKFKFVIKFSLKACFILEFNLVHFMNSAYAMKMFYNYL